MFSIVFPRAFYTPPKLEGKVIKWKICGFPSAWMLQIEGPKCGPLSMSFWCIVHFCLLTLNIDVRFPPTALPGSLFSSVASVFKLKPVAINWLCLQVTFEVIATLYINSSQIKCYGIKLLYGMLHQCSQKQMFQY